MQLTAHVKLINQLDTSDALFNVLYCQTLLLVLLEYVEIMIIA